MSTTEQLTEVIGMLKARADASKLESAIDMLYAFKAQKDSDAKQDEKYQALQDIGKSAAESLAGMVAALECDYVRLEELRDVRENTQGDVHPSDLEELAELEKAAGECESREAAEQRITEDPLSVEVRSGWYTPTGNHLEQQSPEEFCILLSTGGPATRIIGELDEHCEPTRARLQAQDWFTQWTDYTGDAISQDDLLTYCRCFYFGE